MAANCIHFKLGADFHMPGEIINNNIMLFDHFILHLHQTETGRIRITLHAYCAWFTARHNTRIASAVLAIAIPSVCPYVCLSVRPSVTRRYCVKTSKMCLVLHKPKNIPRRRPIPLKSWLQVTYPLLIAASFNTFCLVVPQP